jgi:hypothetical protein
MSFEIPSGAVAGEPDDSGDSEVVSVHEAVIAVAAELDLLQYVMADPVLGSAF